MKEQIGNEQNMATVRALMNKQEATDEVNKGDKSTNSVPIDYVSDFGNEYKGTVVFKRPNVMDLMKMGGIKSEILRVNGVVSVALVDDGVKFMAQVIATLKTVLVKRPEWLMDIDAVEDTDLLFHVYHEYKDWEDTFRKKLDRTEATDDSESAE